MYELGSRTRIAPHQLFSPQHQVHHRLLHRSTAFLDILISLKDGFLKMDIHTKPTDFHAYLPNSSCHPRHVVKNIPYSQFLRLRRLCADTEVFNARCDEMEGRFLRRGHHLKNVQEAGARASSTPRSETLQHKPEQSTNRTPFIVTHHPSNPPLRSWFTELQTSVLHTSRRMQQALPHPPVLGERNCKSLRSLLMPSILPTPPDADPGCFRCDKRPCIACTSHLVFHQPSTTPPPRNHFKSATDLHVKVLMLCTFSTATPANNHNTWEKQYTQD